MDSRAMQDEHPHDEHEKKSVLKKVKAKAKKIKDTITKPKHGHHDDHEHGPGQEHEQYQYEKQHIPDDHDLDQEDDEDEQDPEIHGAPIYDSVAVRNVTPYVQGVDFGGKTLMGEEHHQHEPGRTFVKEERTMISKVNLEEDPHAPGSRFEANVPANYQTKVTDPTGTGGAEIDISPIQESMERMSKQNEPKSVPTPTICETQYPSPCVGIHNQFPPELSRETKTPYPSSTITHDQNLPQLSSEIKTQYPKNNEQFTPVFSTSTQTQHPSHDQNLPHFSNVTKTQYPSSVTTHDHFTPQHHFATSHDQHLPQYFNETKTTPTLIPNEPKPATSHLPLPSTGRHDQFKPELIPTEPKPQHYSGTSHDTYCSGAMESHEPQHQHQFATNMPQHFSAMKTQYPSFEPKLQHQYVTSLPQHSSEIKTPYSSSGSHDQLRAELPTEHHSPQYSSAMRTQYPSAGSHHQFKADLPSEHHSPQHFSAMRTQYPSAGSHNQFTPQLHTTNRNITAEDQPQLHTTNRNITAEDQPQFHNESTETLSNKSNDSYTDKMYSAASTIADKATDAKNAVASKLGYGGENETTKSSETQSNQNSFTEKISSATSAAAEKAATAKNAVASKLGYNGENETTQTKSGETQSNQNSLTDKISSATSVAVDKAAAAKDMVASKLGYGEKGETTIGETPSNQSSYTEKISSATSAVTDKVATAKDNLASKLGYGEKGETGETPSNQNQNQNQSSYTEKISSATSAIADKAASAKNTVASKLGFGETERDSSYEVSPAEYGNRIAVSLTEKLSPVSEKFTTVENERWSGGIEQDKGVSIKDYVSEKLRPGEEDRALSDKISESLYKKNVDETVEEVYDGDYKGKGRDVKKVVSDAVHKRGEDDVDEGRRKPVRGKVTESEEVKRRLGGWDEEIKEGEFGKGMVDMVKDTVESWFGKPGENEATQG
ncbi:hypothetical protein RYX36_009381 [Vicia faba]